MGPWRVNFTVVDMTPANAGMFTVVQDYVCLGCTATLTGKLSPNSQVGSQIRLGFSAYNRNLT